MNNKMCKKSWEGDNHKIGLRAARSAMRVAEDMEGHSTMINQRNEDVIPRLELDEVILGVKLGEGAFNNVYELENIEIRTTATSMSDNNRVKESQQQIHKRRREKLAKTAPNGKYAIKFLKESIITDASAYCNGAADLVAETKVLANLAPHRNIIKLYALSADGIQGFTYNHEGGYFLILDRLHQTLSDCIANEWKPKQKFLQQQQYMPHHYQLSSSSSTTSFLTERLYVATKIACALSHIHKHDFIFRDLKPDNVGFCMNGEVKIFDFGFARHLDERQKSSDGTSYHMSGETGSRAYMAPEVALNQPYNLSADVYSFGVLLWEILTLDKPYNDMTFKEHLKGVCVRGDRLPTDESSWSKQLCNIVSWSWFQHPQFRPTMKQVSSGLLKEIRSLEEQVVVLKDVTAATAATSHTTSRSSSKFKEEFIEDENMYPTTAGNNVALQRRSDVTKDYPPRACRRMSANAA